MLNADEILAFQAEGNIVWIITDKAKYCATQTLTVLEQRLATANFRRIPPERTGERGPSPEDKRTEQPEVADHAKQQSAVRREQEAGAERAADYEVVTAAFSRSIGADHACTDFKFGRLGEPTHLGK